MKTTTARVMRMLGTYNRFLRYVAHQDEQPTDKALRRLRRERAANLRQQRQTLNA